MRLVIIESPFAGDVEGNLTYARAAARDCLQRGESPIASHLLLTQPGILDDTVHAERLMGMAAGWAWYTVADAAVIYLDKGASAGMEAAARHLRQHRPDMPVERRFLAPKMTSDERMAYAFWFAWEVNAFSVAMPRGRICETPLGRLEFEFNKRSPTKAAPWEVKLGGDTVAFYMTAEAACAGAERYFMWRAEQESQRRGAKR